MLQNSKTGPSGQTSRTARDWLKVLAVYRKPDTKRSLIELATTIIPLIALSVGAHFALSVSYWLTLLLIIPAAGLLVRLFLIQHDCGHGAFFPDKKINDQVGRFLGILTLTPYNEWRRSHATHHATSGNLEKRGIGDIDTLTVAEYQSMSRWRKLVYRLYRHPIVMFIIGPAYHFFLRNRLPPGWPKGDRAYWLSTMGSNLALACFIGAMIYWLGAADFLKVYLPITFLAASIGVWLFYIQHQFEDTFWEHDGVWDLPDSALYGSSHLDLPPVLRWFTANIGIHHVHHLSSRIPFYNLGKVLRDYPELADIKRLTIKDAIKCANLRLWDEKRKKLVSFKDTRQSALA